MSSFEGSPWEQTPCGALEVTQVARRFDACLKSGNLGRVPINPALIAAEVREAENDLEVAGKSFKDGTDKWAVKQSHRAIMHIFRALLFMKGYEAKGVDCLKYAMDELYVKKGIFASAILEDFEYGREIAKGNDCLCVYDRGDIEELLASTRVLIEKATEMAKKV
ncbi:MAG TPA: HEPN domain-containing protein [Thermodesulfovibrionales bacterium]|nr:HEPN domain-containing protein [Thermodesulfovibrionales bacterium]